MPAQSIIIIDTNKYNVLLILSADAHAFAHIQTKTHSQLAMHTQIYKIAGIRSKKQSTRKHTKGKSPSVTRYIILCRKKPYLVFLIFGRPLKRNLQHICTLSYACNQIKYNQKTKTNIYSQNNIIHN